MAPVAVVVGPPGAGKTTVGVAAAELLGVEFADTDHLMEARAGKPIPEIKEHECVGCNLCSLVCPVDECITMVSVDTKRPKMSWSDYQAKLSSGEMKAIPPHP